MVEISELKKYVADANAVMGTEETLKQLRSGSLAKVFLASNCPAEVKADIEHYAGMSDVEVIDLPITNEDLGNVSKKPFAIAVMGLKK